MRFGPSGRFELQPLERRLIVDGRPAALGARALDLLIALAERPDHLLTKSELLDRVWPALVVQESNLAMQIFNLRKVLGGEIIATVPGRGYRFTAVPAEAPPDASPGPAASPQPAATEMPRHGGPRLFGREHDLARLERMLDDGGSVTLVGTSGVGKTSLARLAAARHDGRCVWVDLAALPAGSAVTAAVARALGLQLADGDSEPQLLRALEGQPIWLVLDNAEHVVESCARLATLLRPLAGLRLLVTSQWPLAVAGERVQRLEPLALLGDGPREASPGLGPSQASPELGDGALALLVERIVAADHRFQVTPAAMPLLAAICGHLDGLPLALEMAAARVPVLGLQGVADALVQRFALLTRGHRDAAARHRTLHHALAWSYGLLDAAEQRMLRALGTLAGGFTLELAVAVAGGDGSRWEVVELLSTLVERSLVVADTGEPPRYRLLETVRAFALEQLAASGEDGAARARHAAALLAIFPRDALPDAATQARCNAEMENMREAVAWSSRHDLATAAQLTARASPISTWTTWRHETTDWLLALEGAMQQPAGVALPARVQAAWWTELARLLAMRGNARASLAAQRALALWRTLDEPLQTVVCAVVWVRAAAVPGAAPGAELDQACGELRRLAAATPGMPLRQQLAVQGALARAALVRGDYAALLAGRLAELALAQQAGLPHAVDAAESNVVYSLNALGRHGEAAARAAALLARIDSADGDANANLPWVLLGLLESLVRTGRIDEAQALAARGWSAGKRFGTPMGTVMALLASARQRHREAALLVGHARASYATRAITVEASDESLLTEALLAAAAALGAAEVERLVGQGRALGDDAAAAL